MSIHKSRKKHDFTTTTKKNTPLMFDIKPEFFKTTGSVNPSSSIKGMYDSMKATFGKKFSFKNENVRGVSPGDLFVSSSRSYRQRTLPSKGKASSLMRHLKELEARSSVKDAWNLKDYLMGDLQQAPLSSKRSLGSKKKSLKSLKGKTPNTARSRKLKGSLRTD